MATETVLRPVSVVTDVAPLMAVVDKLNAENVPQALDDDFVCIDEFVIVETEELGVNADGVWEVQITVKPSAALLEFAGKAWVVNGG